LRRIGDATVLIGNSSTQTRPLNRKARFMNAPFAVVMSLVLVSGSVLNAADELDEAQAIEQLQLFGGAKLIITPRRPLTWINFPANTIDDEHLYLLRSIKNLSQVILFGNQITDNGIRELKGNDKLRTLDIRSHQISGEGLKALSELKSLEHLSLVDSS